MSTRSYHKLEETIPPPPGRCPMDSTFSPFSEEYVADPYADLEPRREQTPVFYSEALQMVVVTRMDDIVDVFTNPDTFSSENVQDPVFPLSPETVDVLSAPDFNPVAVMSNRQEPDHKRIRQYTKRGFSNRRMKVLEPYIRQRSHELIDAMIAAGSPADFAAGFAAPLPGDTVFRFIGFPEKDDDQLRAWCGDRLAFSWGKPSPEEQVDIANKMLSYWRYCREFTAGKAADLGDDFASELLTDHNENPEDLSYREVESIIYGLSFAGHEPVTLLLLNSLLCFLPRRDVWAELEADPELIPGALEEVIRYESPQIGWRRIANHDTSIGGVDIPKGTRIMLALGAANHQPDIFEEPTVFDIHRPNSRNNISFGKGIHYCLGAKFARFEAKVAMEVLVQRMPSLRMAAGQEELERIANISFRGPTSLIVEWD
ncbi:MAG: cytochrome P450 [Acidimicrobiales bacterium]|nr:cytochrome P450 [Acidimicrobiales bacterium]